jgi:Cu(I)/Ag(I) efflux system periplasmic protein CusF
MRRSGNLVFATLVAFVQLGVPSSAQQPASGEVTNLDQVEAGKITIRHSAIPDLGIRDEGTTNDFRPKDRSLFNLVKVGEKIRFLAERVDGELIITEVLK